MTIAEDQQTTLSQLLEPLCSQGQMKARRQRAVDLSFDEVDERFVWITDGGVRVGLLDRPEATVEWLAPHPGRRPAKPVEIPPVYHAPTYQGGRIIAQWWLTEPSEYDLLPGAPWRLEAGAEPTSPAEQQHPKVKPQMIWKLGPQRGRELRIELTETYKTDPDARGSHLMTIYYDPLADSYVVDVTARLAATRPYLTEPCNFYTGGVYDNRPRTKRHQCTIWTHPDGRLVRWPHNPVGYMTPGMNAGRGDGERRIATGGFIGYFADPHTNPVLEIVQSSHPLAGATCCNIYDEHMVYVSPREKAGDRYEWDIRYRLLSVLPEAAAEIVRRSDLIRFGVDPGHPNPIMTEPGYGDYDSSRRVNYKPDFPSFYYGCVNDFERPIPYDRTVAGCLIWATHCPDNEVYWDDNCGHSGRRSIRLRGRGDGQVTGTRSSGPTPHLDGETQYRISGWIRCQGVTGSARIRFDEVGFHPASGADPSHVAGPVSGTCEWTYVECVFRTPPDAQFGWLYLDLAGPGQAWFDDIALEEC